MGRLEAMLPPDPEVAGRLAKRLKLSNDDRDRLLRWTEAARPNPALTDAELAQAMYAGTQGGTVDVLRLALAKAHAAGDLEEVAGFRRQLDFAEGWERPVFPVQGRDLTERGMKPGPEIGEMVAGDGGAVGGVRVWGDEG